MWRGSRPPTPSPGRAFPDQSDLVAQPAATTATPRTTSTPPRGRPSQRVGIAAGRVVRRLGPVTTEGAFNASANSTAVGNRSAGVFDSARRIASSVASGIVSRTIDGGDTMSREWRAITARAVGPVNGGSPTSISYTTHARLY